MSESLSGLYAQAEIVRIALSSGHLDDLLDTFAHTVKQRKVALSAEKSAALKVGDFVTLTNISPKYLTGMTVRVTGFDGHWIKVSTCGDHRGRFAGDFKIQSAHVGEVRSSL